MSLIQVNWKPNERQLRTFGLICGVVGAVLGVLTLWRGSIFGIELEIARAREVSYFLFAGATICVVFALTKARAFWPLYVLATAISLPIGFVLSYAVLGVLFYLVVTPYGLIFRLIGRDALNRRFDRSARSYWVRRTPVTDMSRYYRQY